MNISRYLKTLSLKTINKSSHAHMKRQNNYNISNSKYDTNTYIISLRYRLEGEQRLLQTWQRFQQQQQQRGRNSPDLWQRFSSK